MHLGGVYLYAAQQYFVGHAVVAVRAVGLDTAFIAPEYIDQLPVNLAAIGFIPKQAVKLLGGIAARQGYSEVASRNDCLVGHMYNILSSLLTDGIEIRIDSDVHRYLLRSTLRVRQPKRYDLFASISGVRV